jgi:hypothetical protein
MPRGLLFGRIFDYRHHAYEELIESSGGPRPLLEGGVSSFRSPTPKPTIEVPIRVGERVTVAMTSRVRAGVLSSPVSRDGALGGGPARGVTCTRSSTAPPCGADSGALTRVLPGHLSRTVPERATK